jgi:hypothetical protein
VVVPSGRTIHGRFCGRPCARILPPVASVTPRSRYWKNWRRPGT